MVKAALTTKLRLYFCCILAVLLYSCETWTLTKADWKRLESFHLRCQRMILSIKWSEVYARSGLQNIQSVVRRRRLSLFGHVACMSDNIPAKAVLRVAYPTSETGFHPSQAGADCGVALPSPAYTRSVQTVAYPLETTSALPRIGPCGVENVRYGLFGVALTTTTTTTTATT